LTADSTGRHDARRRDDGHQAGADRDPHRQVKREDEDRHQEHSSTDPEEGTECARQRAAYEEDESESQGHGRRTC
jgi:hypothetical protein